MKNFFSKLGKSIVTIVFGIGKTIYSFIQGLILISFFILAGEVFIFFIVIKGVIKNLRGGYPAVSSYMSKLDNLKL